MISMRSIGMPRPNKSSAVVSDNAQNKDLRYTYGIGCSSPYAYAAINHGNSAKAVFPNKCGIITAVGVELTNAGTKHGTLLMYSRMTSYCRGPSARVFKGAHQLKIYSFGPRRMRIPSIFSSRGAPSYPAHNKSTPYPQLA